MLLTKGLMQGNKTAQVLLLFDSCSDAVGEVSSLRWEVGEYLTILIT